MDKEQAALLGGAPDLLARLTVLRSRVDEMSFPKPNSPPQANAVASNTTT